MGTEKLIGLVRSNVFLYDVDHNDYKNVVKKAEAWPEIASLSFEHIGLLQFVTTLEILGSSNWCNSSKQSLDMRK